ncbi:efflux RND transporter periplasmic adaptor subunit [Phenylobacterium sp.]|uniref:efflux RND transporter periplasmic adaptor subunit n=1 Tax=Phenylobacterium sp. TaxID=1871053 RepID=UPI002FE10AB5
MAPPTSARRRPRLSRPLIIGLGVLALVIAAIAALALRPKEPKDPYRTGAVERGAITRSVSASGTLQALEQVEVGSQISGLVQRVLVDFNDPVRRGQTLAVIDPQTYQSRVAQSQADIDAGVAALRQAEATLANAEADHRRKKELVDRGFYAPSVLDQATAALRSARAGVTAARARIAQGQAQLRSQQVDLGRTTIVSPIDGLVIDRKIEPGQTVAASFQAPVLFTIARDLSRLEVKISVDEADVGQVQEGQAVRFTVDAFPEDTFQGLVTEVRKQPTTEQNVVAYTVIAEADNPRGRLLPGMTANADIIIETRPNVVKVPAAALRWTPPQDAARPGAGGPPAMGGGLVVGGPVRPGGGQANGQRQVMGAQVADQLDLNAAQRKQWEAISTEMREKIRAAMASSGGDRAAARETLTRIRNEAFAKIEPSLNADQKARLAALRATLAAGGGAGGMRAGVVYVLKDGKPSAVPVRVGATDGTSTEVASPQLKVGDEVIVGGGPKAKVQARTPLSGGGGQTRARM